MVKSDNFLEFKGQNKRFLKPKQTKVNSIKENPKKVRLQDLSFVLKYPKTLKRVKISQSLFCDFQIGLRDKMDHEESENRGPKTLESTHFDFGRKKTKLV